MEEPLEEVGLGKQVVWVRVSGNHQDRGTMLTRLIESTDFVPAGWEEGSSTKTVVPAEESFSPLPEVSQFSSSPYVSGAL